MIKKLSLILLLFTLLFVNVNAVVTNDDLVHYWNFSDYNGSDIIDLVSNKVIYAGTTDNLNLSNGIYNEYMETIAGNVGSWGADISPPETINGWFKMNQTGDYMFRIVFTTGQLQFLLGRDGHDLQVLDIGSVNCNRYRVTNSPIDIYDNNWHMITASNESIYIDGQSISYTPLTAGTCPSGVTLDNSGGFGGFGASNFNPTNAGLDELMFFNRVLTNDEVLSLYNNGTGNFYSFIQEQETPIENVTSQFQAVEDITTQGFGLIGTLLSETTDLRLDYLAVLSVVLVLFLGCCGMIYTILIFVKKSTGQAVSVRSK